MHNIELIKKMLVLSLLLFVFGAISENASAAPASVNLVLYDGSVLIYHGKEAGYQQGQILQVLRGGAVVGALQVLEIKDAYVRAVVLEGSGQVLEGDTVIPAEGGASPSTGAVQSSKPIGDDKSAAKSDTKKSEKSSKKDDSKKSDKKSSKKDDSETSSKRRSSRAKDDSGSEDDSSKSSSRSRSSRSSKSDDSGDKADDSGSSRSRSSRGSRGSSSDDSGDKAGEEKEQVESKVMGRAKHHSLHIGYFYIDPDVPGSNTNSDPAESFGIDYWIPRKPNTSLVYSVSYARPVVTTHYADQDLRYQLRIFQFNATYVWENLSWIGARDMYAGIGSGWRQSRSNVHCSITCDGTTNNSLKTMQGFDYHAVIGFKLRKKSEVKLDYSFDENYYTIDVGLDF